MMTRCILLKIRKEHIVKITKQRLKQIIKEELEPFLPGLEPPLSRQDSSSKFRYMLDIKRIMARDGKDPLAAAELVKMAAKPEKAHLVDQAAQELAAEYETISEGFMDRFRKPSAGSSKDVDQKIKSIAADVQSALIKLEQFVNMSMQDNELTGIYKDDPGFEASTDEKMSQLEKHLRAAHQLLSGKGDNMSYISQDMEIQENITQDKSDRRDAGQRYDLPVERQREICRSRSRRGERVHFNEKTKRCEYDYPDEE